VRSSRSGLSGINHPVENLNRNPRQANKLLSQQNRHFSDMSPLAMNVGFQGKSGSNADIAEPSLLTHFGHLPDDRLRPWLTSKPHATYYFPITLARHPSRKHMREGADYDLVRLDVYRS
jgi:hypothetical protein